MKWTEKKLAAELDRRGWRLVHYEDGNKVKEGISPFRATRPRNGTEVAARTVEKLLYRVDAYERELTSRGLEEQVSTVAVSQRGVAAGPGEAVVAKFSRKPKGAVPA